MTLNPPNLAVCGPFFMDAEGTLEVQSDRSAAVPRHTQLLVMTSHRSVGEKKNNELMMTHRTHASMPGLTCMHTHKLINFLWD